ncbi:hypothetical protein DSO57_1005712 [Entomophthora muscae]|uniref:Uncharacterized protein n=1 Tax=Entomophthora muscae TaxID=34485 RepID=A0ACC2SKS0_9FUNG|nr:hypothetical protein DSO57_1005712 [Entomophthora muscae]
MFAAIAILSFLSNCFAEYLVTPRVDGFAEINVPMVLNDQMFWTHGSNFTEAHLVDSINRNPAPLPKACIYVKERPGQKTCFIKEKEYYSWDRVTPISRPRVCPKSKVCTFNIIRKFYTGTFMAVFDPYNFDWIHMLKPSIPAPLSYATSASINMNREFSFRGPANKTLLFKRLQWNIVLSVESDPDLKFSLLFPVVLPTGELDGVYMIGTPPRYVRWNGLH